MKLKKNTLKKHLSPFNQSAYRLLDGEGESKGSLSKTKSKSKSKSKEGLKMKGTDGMKRTVESFDSS
jgi:hypothetical protein